MFIDRRIIVFVAAMLSHFASGSEPETAVCDDELNEVVHGSNQFAVDLYQRLSENRATNIIVSPQSIASVLAMTHAGANHQTRQQIGDVLRTSMPSEKLHKAFERLLKTSARGSKQPGIELHVARNLWVQDVPIIHPHFLEICRQRYGAEIAQLDCSSQTEAVRQAINSRVSDQTAGKIVDFLPAEMLANSTQLTLLDAVYFKGNWTHEFNASETRASPFHTSVATHVTVPMMYQKTELRYAEFDDMEMLELPYGLDGSISMVVILPRSVEGLESLPKKLSMQKLNHYYQQLEPKAVELHLPRFAVSSHLLLKPVLELMGVDHAFDPQRADFSQISSDENLFLSNVIHKANIEVTELGTSAAAATAAIVVSKGFEKQGSPPISFRVDHPFMLLIRDNTTKCILFIGKITDPSK
ncbi:MAG: serpin family protein [Planctomycetes bacterium]|nr:serpin family protein [Planctomycetota bacterium]